MKLGRLLLVLLLGLGLLGSPALAVDSPQAAQEAYAAIEAAMEEAYGVDAVTGVVNFPSSFAGAWLDEDNHLVVALTDDSQETRAYYAGLSGNEAVVRFVAAKYSLQALLQVQTEISNGYTNTDETGFYMQSAVIDLTRNAVELTVLQGGVAAAQAYYAAYGDAVTITEGEALLVAPTGQQQSDGITIKLWVLLVLAVAALAVVGLLVFLLVRLLVRRKRRRAQQRRDIEQAAARAARAGKQKS